MKGWDVAAEHSSTEGLGRAAAEAFDLILLDYHLPDGTGLDLCRQIRLFDVSTPILLVTVTHSIEHDEVLVAGGQGVIRKDHLVHVLPVAVANALELNWNCPWPFRPREMSCPPRLQQKFYLTKT